MDDNMDDRRNLTKKGELKDSHTPGFAQGLWDFLKLLEDMENKKETMRTTSRELEGPPGSKAVYGYTVKLGIEARYFPLIRRFHPRPRSEARKKNEVKQMTDVKEEYKEKRNEKIAKSQESKKRDK